MNFVHRYWRFALFFVLLVAGAAVLTIWLDPAPALLVAFDAATCVFIASFFRLFASGRAEDMRKRAGENEPDAHILQIVAAAVVAVVGVAVGYQVADKEPGALVLAALTLFLAWLFGNVLFTLHYAHAYYLGREGGGDCKGLEFPDEDVEPDYWDFAYFSFVIGTAFAVSDVRVASRRLRRVILLHSTVAFWFNIVVVALTISLISAELA